MDKSLIIERYKNPKYFSKDVIPNGSSINSQCGDEIFVKTNVDNGKLISCEYNGSGCSICLGTTDILIDNIIGKEVSKIKDMKEAEVLQIIGMEENSGRRRCATLSIEAILDSLNKVE